MGRPCEEMEMNINDNVEVILTDEGMKIFSNPLYWPYQLYNLKGRKLKIQLWLLMQMFGEHMRMGALPYFKNNEIRMIE